MALYFCHPFLRAPARSGKGGTSPFRYAIGLRVLLFLAAALFPPYDYGASPSRAGEPGNQPAPSGPQSPRTIVDLQPSRVTTSIMIKGARGEEGKATLINLNPQVNAWYLLRLKWSDASPEEEAYHLENVNPKTQRLSLEGSNPHGFVISSGEDREICELWGSKPPSTLRDARKSGVPYAPLCGGKVFLRNPTKGHKTAIEAVTDFLREKVPAGEEIVGFVRDTFFKYIYQQKAQERVESKTFGTSAPREPDTAPSPALLDPEHADRLVKPADLGIEIQESNPNGMGMGRWVAVKDNPGIYVSLIVPGGIAPEILRSYRNRVSGLDPVEAKELVYLVAFDLGQFNLHYTLGTDHPKVGWSERILDQVKDRSLPGPDGIGSIAPLSVTGLVDPQDTARTVATFTGGFKRIHGAFKYGALAHKNFGSHYGFMEEGVILSTLQPGLATIYVLHDGWADMKTWTEKDTDLLPGIKCARQNGVPIIAEFDPANRLSVPGPLVARWGEGNWSGSANEKLRTLRAGAALQESRGRRFLLYAFFWSATPSAMARVFQAYQCRYAMLLDMNALEHTYLALYQRQGANFYVQHLIRGMREVDLSVKGRYIPRFLGYADDRDFFYLTRKEDR